jgi:tetratricopeptide (TPR) repeat protein
MGTALLLTFTRGSLLAIAVTIPVLIFFYYRSAASELNKKHYRKIALYFLILVIVAAAVLYIPHPLNQKGSTLGKLKERVTIESITSGSSMLRRVAIWKFTWMMIEDRPLLGSGIGTYGYQSLPYQAEFFAQGNNRDIYPHGFAVQAHNEYLQIWSEMGIIGLLLFLGIIFIYYRNIFINFRKMGEKEKAIIIGLAGAVTAVLVDAIFGFPLQLAASSSLFWIFLGLCSAQINISISCLFRPETELVNQHPERKQKKVKNAEDEISRKSDNNTSSGNTIKTIKKIFLSILVIALMIGAISFLIRPFMARVYWYHGNQQIVKGNYQEAIKIYEKGLKWNPWQGEMYYDIGNILANEGLNTPALEYLHKAAKYVDHHNLPQKIAVLYIKKGEIGKAIPYLEKAITYQQKKEDMLPLQLQLGNLYLTIKDYQNAERQFQNVLQINPESAEAYYGLAGAYVNQGKKEETIAALQKVIELAPESRVAGYAKTMLTKIELEQKEKEQ